jgi:hypothetical protein
VFKVFKVRMGLLLERVIKELKVFKEKLEIRVIREIKEILVVPI